jgi:regulator of RNase E activity RraA
MPKTDEELFSTIRSELFAAVLGDVLDKLGYRHQFLPPELKPLDPRAKLVGRAMPVVEADVFSEKSESAGPLADQPFGLMFRALDDLKPGEIYIATGASPRYALWGGLMSTRAMHLGAAGSILDGFVRDAGEIEQAGYTVFSRGLYAQDQGVRGKVIDFRTAVEIGGVRIEPGTLIFGDREGVLVVPGEVEDEAVPLAIEKVRGENKVADAIRGGMSAQEAFDTFGIM